MGVVRQLAREGKRALGRDRMAHHELAARLWASGVHEARIMAALVDDPELVTRAQAECWVADLDSWDVCDQLAINLLRKTAIAWDAAKEWTRCEPEFTKRIAFSLGATLGVHEKSVSDERFVPLLECAVREADDARNGVKKAVSWQMRQIGKRNAALNALAIAACDRILAQHPDSRSARWIARDVTRELRSDAVRKRLGIA
jgi:3-methyladenine DNA glycosylase AlkD